MERCFKDSAVSAAILGEDEIIQPDGRIIVVGKRGGAEEDVAVLHLLENGTLDNSFSGNGVATVNIGVNAEGLAVALQGDGAMVVGGSAEFEGGSFDGIAFARFSSGANSTRLFPVMASSLLPNPVPTMRCAPSPCSPTARSSERTTLTEQ